MPILQTVLMSLKPMFWGNNMLDRHSMTYSQLNTVEKAELEKQENRAGWIGAAILIIMYCAASTMEYNDCINLGVC